MPSLSQRLIALERRAGIAVEPSSTPELVVPVTLDTTLANRQLDELLAKVAELRAAVTVTCARLKQATCGERSRTADTIDDWLAVRPRSPQEDE